MREYLKEKQVEYTDFVKGLKERKAIKQSSHPKVLHKGLDISGPSVRCLWIDSTNFEELQPQNLNMDMPINVN